MNYSFKANEDDIDQIEDEDYFDEIDTHFEEDLQHLIFNLFRVEPSQGARILSLQLNNYKITDKQRQAIVVGDRLKDFLANNSLEDVNEIHSPVPNYQVYTNKVIKSFIEKLEQKRSFTQICDLYDKREYALVKSILETNLPRTYKQKSGVNIENRLYHLKMMIDTLWNLDQYEECIGWIEIALHETKHQMQHRNASNESLDLSGKQYIDLLKSLDCCVCMFEKDNDFAGIEEPFRARLANNLLDLCLEQVEGKEEILDGHKTTLPWVLLYKLISFAEQQESESNIESPPGSINFLCSAHDYLGQLSMCTKEEGRLLLLQGDAIVSTLFKGVKERAMADQLRKNLDQAMYCLYAHPSKKSKLKHLVDHSVSNIALRWERCMSPYQYLRPEKLPEYDDFKSNSILAETVLFFKRVVALIPDQFDLQGRNKAVKEYLTSGSDIDFPKFSKVPQKERPLLDVLYLLADYYFKNNEFTTALEYYRYDLCFNQDRVDSWFPLALSLVNVLEQKLNETYKDPASGKVIELADDIIKRILVDSDVIMKCYERCHILSPKNSMICIESANFAYTMHSFCTRQLDILDSLEESVKLKLKHKAPVYLKYASEYYDRALKLMEAQEEPDEMWLLHFMKGKICEKNKLPIQKCLAEYEKALDMLLELNATLPKKIIYNSPAELSLELLEVYYRIHATILKQEFITPLPPSSEILKCVGDLLDKIGQSKIFAGVSITQSAPKTKEEKTQSSETDSSEPPSKVAKLDDIPQTTTWDTISTKCIEAMESIFRRFPQHFKSIHLFSRYHLKTTTSKRDIKKSQKYLWGQINSGSKNTTFAMALFGERKSNNLFNGIWRLPISEIDRAGSFSAHINKCMITLLDLAKEMNDQNILLEVALQLRRPPDVNQKYLYEKQRKNIAQKSYSLLNNVLKSRVDEHIKFDSSLETRLIFLFEIYQMYSKLRRLWQNKDESFVSILIDLFKSMGGNGSSEEVISFCTKVTSMSKKGADSPQSLAAIVKGDPMEFLKKEMQVSRHGDGVRNSPTSNASTNSQGGGSKMSKLAAESSLPSTSAAAAMEYLNAASSYYSNELAKMAAYLQSTTPGITSVADAQALLSAYASYGLLESVNPTSKPSSTATIKQKEVNKKATTLPTQRSHQTASKGVQMFSHKPQSNTSSGQSKAIPSVGNKYTAQNPKTTKPISKKPSCSQGESLLPNPTSSYTKPKPLNKSTHVASTMANKPPASSTTGQSKTSTAVGNKFSSLKHFPGKQIPKKSPANKAEAMAFQHITSATQHKPKPKNIPTASSLNPPKTKTSQSMLKAVQNQKTAIPNTSVSKSQVIDDEDVICID